MKLFRSRYPSRDLIICVCNSGDFQLCHRYAISDCCNCLKYPLISLCNYCGVFHITQTISINNRIVYLSYLLVLAVPVEFGLNSNLMEFN